MDLCGSAWIRAEDMLPLLTDLKHALRSLRKSPAFAGIGVLSLALGIGANVTIYSIVREMVLDDISARQPDRLARVDADIPYDRYRELRDAGVFQDLAFSLWFTDINWISDAHGEVVADQQRDLGELAETQCQS